MLKEIIEVNNELKKRLKTRLNKIPKNDLVDFLDILIQDLNSISTIIDNNVGLNITTKIANVYNDEIDSTNLKQYTILDQQYHLTDIIVLSDKYDSIRNELIQKLNKNYNQHSIFFTTESYYKFAFSEFLKRGYLFILTKNQNHLLVPIRYLSGNIETLKNIYLVLNLTLEQKDVLLPFTYLYQYNSKDHTKSFTLMLSDMISDKTAMKNINFVISDENNFYKNLFLEYSDISSELKEIILNLLI